AEEIERGGQGLLAERNRANGLPSVIAGWPDGDDVPKVLRPSANEFLLEDLDGFGAALRDLIRRSSEVEAELGGFRSAAEQVIMGNDGLHPLEQAVVNQPARWTPESSDLHVELSSAQRANFDVRISAEELLERAAAWLSRPGTPAGNYVA